MVIDISGEKVCVKCGQSKVLSEYQKRNRRTLDGHDNICKVCTREEYRAFVESMTDEKIAEIEKFKPFKYCGKCKQTKPITDFRIDRQNTDGHYPLCKPCETERIAVRYHKRGEYFSQYRNDTKQRYADWHKEYRENIKMEVLTYYGNGKCACVRCGFSDMRALSIDHINGDGAKHRKELSSNPQKRYTGLHMYKWIQDNHYPDGFRTLCLNCQFIVEFERRENKVDTQGLTTVL